MKKPFLHVNSLPEIIRLTVMMYVRYPLSLRQVEDLLFKRGIDICHETVRFWWNRFGPMFAAEIRKRRVVHHSYSNWRWYLLEDVAAVEVAILIEMIMDRGVDGGEFLQGFNVPELRHRPLSSSERLMRVFGPIVEPATALLGDSVTDHLHRRTV